MYFTSLLEYQTKMEAAQPSFSISFYTELMESKNIILMLGHLTSNANLALKDAQHLVYQLQLFYMVGNEAHWKMVEKFHNTPQEFNYKELIDLVTNCVTK